MMRTYAIPDFGTMHLTDLVLDFNGTLATDGLLLTGLSERFERIAADMTVHVVTGDTHGTAASQLQGLGCRLHIVPSAEQGRLKREYVLALGSAGVAAIGNGRNDARMLRAAALGIAILGEEGCAGDAIAAADLVVRSMTDALDLLLHPQRLVATLRS